jgi:flagellar biosynthesis/type III secretory pathway protein FliH
MSSSGKPRGIIRSAGSAESEVFVIGQPNGEASSLPGPVATAREIVDAAGREAAAIREAARGEAARILAEARASADGVRQAAREGAAIRDSIAASHEALLARALVQAVRRLVADHYLAQPEHTMAICREALRATAGQDVIAIRLNPRVAGAARAELLDLAGYVRPDDGVAVGGCIIDLRHGTIDATLDARLALFSQALTGSEELAA